MSDNVLAMSDEEFMDQVPEMESVIEATPEDTGSEEVVEVEALAEVQEEESEGGEYLEEPEEADEGEEEDHAQEEQVEESTETGSDDEVTEAPVTGADVLLQPFKANGKEVHAKTPEEALQLMQMGANYTKKMQALQPNLKLLKTLEKNQLLDADKLNYLIDLSNKDPKAISQLIKEAEIDPLELEESTEYTPTNHQVTDQAMMLDTVLDSIESTPTYNRCMDVVGNQWDEASQVNLSGDPQRIAEINEHMQSGIFDKINGEVERVKMFGGLANLSDFDAYKAVGKQMLDAGKLGGSKPEPVATSKPKAKDNTRSIKRRAASTPKSSRKQTTTQSLSPLAMSDEEFMKIHNINL